MDPLQALIDADQAISDCDPATAAVSLMNYRDWRRAGGFEPGEIAGTLLYGDKFERQCYDRLLSLNRQLKSPRHPYGVTLRLRDSGSQRGYNALVAVEACSAYEALQAAVDQKTAEAQGNYSVDFVVSLVQV